MSIYPDTISEILSQLTEQKKLTVCGLYSSSNAFFLSEIIKNRRSSICCLVADDEQLGSLANDISLFSDIDVLVYPSFEIPPYTPLSPDPITVANRLTTLYRLLNGSQPHISLISVEAVLRRIIPKKILGNRCELLMAGEETDRNTLIQSLTDSGYQYCSMVQHLGDLAVRGSIIDIFAPAVDNSPPTPLRLDFFGDTLESIRYFDPISQRSIKELEEIIILPCSDILFPKESSPIAWKKQLRETAGAMELNHKTAAPVLDQ